MAAIQFGKDSRPGCETREAPALRGEDESKAVAFLIPFHGAFWSQARTPASPARTLRGYWCRTVCHYRELLAGAGADQGEREIPRSGRTGRLLLQLGSFANRPPLPRSSPEC